MSLLNNPKKSQIIVAAFLVAATLAWATRCHAEQNYSYSQVSYGRTVARGMTDVLDLSYAWKAGQVLPVYNLAGEPRDERWQIGLTLIGSSKYGVKDQPNNFRVKAQWVDGFGNLDLGVGLSYGQNTDSYNGSNVNFALSIAYRFQTWPVTVTYAHDSNAGTKMPNVGRDYVLIGWRFR